MNKLDIESCYFELEEIRCTLEILGMFCGETSDNIPSNVLSRTLEMLERNLKITSERILELVSDTESESNVLPYTEKQNIL